MGRHTLHGNPPIHVLLRRSAQARRLSLRVSRLDGRVTLTLPMATPDRDGVAFLQGQEAWLRGHLQQLATVVPVAVGAVLPVAGRPCQIVPGATRRVTFAPGQIAVPDPATAAPRIKAALQVKARDALAAASDHYAGLLGVRYGRLSLRDTRSRWGSCSSRGGLMYSWRLIMAPPAVLDYVAAHEVAHLREMNHSAAFWAIVARLCPDYQHHRDWLRDHGTALHRYQFAD